MTKRSHNWNLIELQVYKWIESFAVYRNAFPYRQKSNLLIKHTESMFNEMQLINEIYQMYARQPTLFAQFIFWKYNL